MVICLSIEYNGGTQADDLLDVESQRRFTAVSILPYLASLFSGMPIWWVVFEISAQNLLHRVSILTVELLLFCRFHKYSGLFHNNECLAGLFTMFTVNSMRNLGAFFSNRKKKFLPTFPRWCRFLFLLWSVFVLGGIPCNIIRNIIISRGPGDYRFRCEVIWSRPFRW